MSGFRHHSDPDPISREALLPSANYIKQRCEVEPQLGIICGSGLGELGELVSNASSFSYQDIPNFPASTAPGHKGRLVLGYLNGVPVVLMQGRLHSYEGLPLWQTTLPVRVMKLLGIQAIIITNAVGAINMEYKVGDLMLVKDHLNWFGLAGQSPLRGPNDESFGPRFFDINNLYNKTFRTLAKDVAKQVGMADRIREGILTISGGPNYESITELKMCKWLGVDCVGMSAIPEALTAHHCGVSVLAFSLVTNMCTTDLEADLEGPNHQEVLEVAEQNKESLKAFVSLLVRKISEHLLEKGRENGDTNGGGEGLNGLE